MVLMLGAIEKRASIVGRRDLTSATWQVTVIIEPTMDNATTAGTTKQAAIVGPSIT